MTRAPAPELSPAEAARVAAFDAAPTPPEVVVAGIEARYRQKRHEYGSFYIESDDFDALLAAAAIAALPPSPAEEAVKRVSPCPRDGSSCAAICGGREACTALASPAPAPQGEEPTCYCGRLGHRLGGPILHKRTEACPR